MAPLEGAFIHRRLAATQKLARNLRRNKRHCLSMLLRAHHFFGGKPGRVLKEREPDLRRHPRVQASWPVTVEVEGEAFQVETLNLSPFGAKLAAGDLPLKPGTPALLHIHPPEGEPLDIQAILWRIDPDGPVFFFIGLSKRLFSTEAS